MAVEVIHEGTITRATASRSIHYLMTKWQGLSVVNKLTYRDLIEGGPFDPRPDLVVMAAIGDDFCYLYVGEAVQRAVGADFTGKLMASIADPVVDDLRVAYRAAADLGRPLLIRFTSSTADEPVLFERLVLPVRLEAGVTLLVCLSEVLNYKQEVYEYIFRTSFNPFLVLFPILDREHRFDDGWVILMNDTARRHFSFAGRLGNLRVRELPTFQCGELWEELRACYASAQPSAPVPALSEDGQFAVELVRLSNLVLLRFRHAAETEKVMI